MLNAIFIPKFECVPQGDLIRNLKFKKGTWDRPVFKAMEQLDTRFLVPWAGMVDGLTCASHEWSMAQALEKAAGLTLDRRNLYSCTVFAEINRLVWLSTYLGRITRELGSGMLSQLIFSLRESVLALQEDVTGGRILLHIYAVGGVRRTLALGDGQKLLGFVKQFKSQWSQWKDLVGNDEVMYARLRGLLVVPIEFIRKYSWWGIVGKAAGLNYDSRKHRPHGAYAEIDFEIPGSMDSDALSRFKVACDEIDLSVKLLEKMLTQIPVGEQKSLPELSLNKGIWTGCAESAKGPVITALEVSDKNLVVSVKQMTSGQRVWPYVEKLFCQPENPTRTEDLRLGFLSLGLDQEDAET